MVYITPLCRVRMLLFFWLCMAIYIPLDGARILQCDSGFMAAVEGDTGFKMACDTYSGSILWQFQQESQPLEVIGTCNSTSCQGVQDFQRYYQLQWQKSFASSLKFISADVTSRQYSNYTYICDHFRCRLAVIVPAELGAPSLVLGLPSQGGRVTVTGTVNITRVYSSHEQLYNCTWTRRQQGGQSIKVTSKDLFPGPNHNKEDRSGSCDVTDSLPASPATYNYTVTVYPGATVKTQSVAVESPHRPNISCSPSTFYVSEGTKLNCRCSGRVGRPAGRLKWVRRDNNVVTTGSYGQNTLQLTMTVDRSHDGNTLRCDVDWATVTTGPIHTIRVAYGPDSVSIPESREFYTDSAGNQSLTLTCSPRDVNPTTGLTYTWTGRCADVTTDTCSFRPRPPGTDGGDDVGATVQCDVTNPFNNKMAQAAALMLQLKYPPRDAPQIQGYTGHQILYKGDPLNLSCTVSGGDPTVTSVTLNCTSRPQGPSNGQSSILSVTSLHANDHGAVCTCSARWTKPEFYTRTDSRTLTVYYPPSQPDVTGPDANNKPYLEGDSVTLTCSLTSGGHPAANLTWSGHGNGVISHADLTTSTLRLKSVGKGDNLRNITCHAVNEFTLYKHRDLSDVYTLHVYYRPDITLTSSDGNRCFMTTDPMTCTTVEGQRVHFRSSADSSPAPERYVWLSPNGLDLRSGRDLDIVSVNRTHSGVYRVQVNTTVPDDTDSRLPLTSNRNLTVLVNYTASGMTFGIGNNKTLTVNESDVVTFDCESRGRPTPELQLTQRDKVFSEKRGGKLSLSEETTRLSHTITAQCSNTDIYTCSAHNGVGNEERDTVQLFVNCKPRKASSSGETPQVNYQGMPVFMDFQLIAYPVPREYLFTFLGNPNDTNVKDNIKLNATCEHHDDEEYNVTCNVKVSDASTPEAGGLYNFTAANKFGQEVFSFEVIINGTEDFHAPQTTAFNILAVVSGIVAALIVVAVIAVVLIIVRRRRKGAEKSRSHLLGKRAAHTREEPDTEMTVNELYGTSPGGAAKDDGEVMIVNTTYVSSDDLGRSANKYPGNAYEDVELNSSKRPNASASNHSTALGVSKDDNGSNLYATVNKGTRQSNPPPERAGPSSLKKPDVKPKPAKKSKPEKLKNKPKGMKNGKQDDEQRLRTGEYSNVAMAPLTMSPRDQEASVYENYAFQKEEDKRERSCDESSPRTVNDDGLVYTTVAFTDMQLKKAEEPPPLREQTEYVGIDFTRKAPPAERNN